MRYKSLLGVAGLIVAAGCGGTDTETVATSSAYVAPLADYGYVYDTALWYNGVYDPLTGVYIGQITPGDAGVLDGSVLDGGVVLDGGAVVPTKTLPRPLSGLLGAWRVLVSSNCIPSTAFVDNDGDKVPATYTATFNCPNQMLSDRTVSITGTVNIVDNDDNNPKSGFTMTFTDFNVVTVICNRTRSRTTNGTASVTPIGGAFQSSTNLTVAFDFTDANGDKATGTWTTNDQGTYTPDPNVGTDIFAMGTVNLTGTSTLQRAFNGQNQSRMVTRQTNPQLHWNRSCKTQTADSIGYDSGTLIYQDTAGSQLQLKFNGCGNPSITSK